MQLSLMARYFWINDLRKKGCKENRFTVVYGRLVFIPIHCMLKAVSNMPSYSSQAPMVSGSTQCNHHLQWRVPFLGIDQKIDEYGKSRSEWHNLYFAVRRYSDTTRNVIFPFLQNFHWALLNYKVLDRVIILLNQNNKTFVKLSFQTTIRNYVLESEREVVPPSGKPDTTRRLKSPIQSIPCPFRLFTVNRRNVTHY